MNEMANRCKLLKHCQPSDTIGEVGCLMLPPTERHWKTDENDVDPCIFQHLHRLGVVLCVVDRISRVSMH